MSRHVPVLHARSRATRRRTHLAGGVAVLVAAVTAAAATTGGAVAVAGDEPGSSPGCPLPWSGGFTEGQAVEGLTTVRGTEPGSFSGTYLDTIPDGIGRGRDMLIFRLSGSRITDADGDVDAGVWAGISGSPIYDPGTGALVGAVSYGRSWANDVIAGVTPAADMYDRLLGGGAGRTEAPALVDLPRAARSALADEGVAVRRSSTLRRLDSPTYVSGVDPAVARAIGKKAGRAGTTYAAGVAAAPTGPELPIVPGGNIATSWSHGDITSAGIGSVTAVCGDQVLAYGHPDTWSGDSHQSVHGARALGILAEGGFGAFKDVAEIGAPVGTLTQDRLEGVVGTLGTLPVSADVDTTTSYRGSDHTGHTVVTEMDTLPDVLAMQTYDDTVTAMNAGYPRGEAVLRWTISFDHAGAAPGTFTRTQRYSSRSDLAWDVTGDIAADASAILDNPFREVTITGVTVTSDLTDAYRAYRVGRVQVLRGGRFRTVRRGRTIAVPRGRALVVRTHYPRADRWSAVPAATRTTRYRVPRGAVGTGRLTIRGNSSSWDDFGFFSDFGDDLFSGGGAGRARGATRNLAQLLRAMGGEPRNDEVSGSLTYRQRRSPGRVRVQRREHRLPAVVRGSFRLRVRFR